MLRIAHDPGHGTPFTYDDGSAGYRSGIVHAGVSEAAWVLRHVRYLAEVLAPMAVHQILRTSEVGGSYADRASKVDPQTDLVICHHVNGQFDDGGNALPKIDGLMVFNLPGSYVTREVGEAIMRAAPSELRRHKQKVIPANPGDWTRRTYNVMQVYHRIGYQVLLIEWGFATSPIDRAVLLAEKSTLALAGSLAAGIGRLSEL